MRTSQTGLRMWFQMASVVEMSMMTMTLRMLVEKKTMLMKLAEKKTMMLSAEKRSCQMLEYFQTLEK